ncbi:MAG: phosphonate C-P lyase system protein PhnL [Rhodovarius sp.]|nr:phosphonate C-P lyase system protein PhnL [Rhodovarius sp.]
MQEVLRIEGLAKTFTLHLQGGARIVALEGVSLSVAAGECVALAGPSGAGKSTLMRCVWGSYGAGAGRILLRHAGGEIDLARADARSLREIRRTAIGYVSQFLRVIPRVPALEIVAEPMIAAGMAAEAARERARALLLRLNLPEALHALPPATFSGGEQQRVNLARGFGPPRRLLLLDEPTASLDPANAEVVVGLIEEAKRAGVAILGIFHDQAVRDRVADRLFELHPVRERA